MDKSKIPTAQRAALSLLLDDHRSVKKLFKSFESAKERSEKEQIAQQACRELTVHAQIEEEIFYPGVRGVHEKLDKMLDEAKVEHQSAKDLIAQIEGDLGGEMMEAQFTVLAEYVNHHVEEEENEIFKLVIDKDCDLAEMAKQMAARKEELMASA
ncbi:hemerythrin HHE cation binding domain-containing protein [Cupriavidus gilardii J11]|uniref:Hemerythrin HHE cation binding domain-containing protein n=1 Tax=Cupriavidus gilardii J11 TaxID=936133 RepID=A0A562B9D6_9BURK|nr:hemerythrin domain-containing protein [Cupriavidus gilardii]TWG81743.1 hemerythrin HHE cation binding domain-containing protein [Cupriavidus gilardii J11]